MKNKIIPLLVIFLAGCSSVNNVDNVDNIDKRSQVTDVEHFNTEKIVLAHSHSTPTRPFLRNSDWFVSEVNGKALDPEYKLTLSFRNNIFNKHDFLISGKSGCNSYQGYATLEVMQGRLLSDQNFLSSNFHCENANLLSIEREFLRVLFDNRGVQQNGERSIFLRSNTHVFKLERKLR